MFFRLDSMYMLTTYNVGTKNFKGNKMKTIIYILATLVLVGCGSLEKKSILISNGDTKAHVIKVMGTPDDRQLRGKHEAWQYCQTGAGFGYHDYRVFWFYSGKVTGVNSYKSSRPASSCMTDIRQVNWENAPDITVEVRNR